MLRLIFADLVANARIWLGVFALTVTAGGIGGIAASLTESGIVAGGAVQEGLAGITAAVAVFSGVTALAVLGSTATLTVTLQQRGYALWQLVGIPPTMIGLVVLAQLFVVAVIGATVGSLAVSPAVAPFFSYVFAGQNDLEGVRVHYGAVSVGWVILAVAGVVVLGGLRSARRASRVGAIEALREPEPARLRMGWLRCLLAAGLLAGVVGMSAGMAGSSFSTVSSQVMLLSPLVAALFTALGPVLFPVVLRGWTALVPPRASASWFLARNSARYRLSQSTAAISPLLVGIALTGGLYSAASTLAAALELQTGRTAGYDLAPEGVVMLLGGPLLLAAVAAAATVFMSGHARERDFALLQAAGAGQGTIIAAAAWEAVIYVVTATILGGAVVVAGGLVTAAALSTIIPGVAPVFALGPPALVAGCGLVLVAAATVLPTVTALRRDIARTLAAE